MLTVQKHFSVCYQPAATVKQRSQQQHEVSHNVDLNAIIIFASSDEAEMKKYPHLRNSRLEISQNILVIN